MSLNILGRQIEWKSPKLPISFERRQPEEFYCINEYIRGFMLDATQKLIESPQDTEQFGVPETRKGIDSHRVKDTIRNTTPQSFFTLFTTDLYVKIYTVHDWQQVFLGSKWGGWFHYPRGSILIYQPSVGVPCGTGLRHGVTMYPRGRHSREDMILLPHGLTQRTVCEKQPPHQLLSIMQPDNHFVANPEFPPDQALFL